MTRDGWSRIERIYHAALEREAGERRAFVEEACGGDHELRHEIETLLQYSARADAFLEHPVIDGLEHPVIDGDKAVRSVALPSDTPPGRLAGRRFGAYELEALIAAGGMGEVYRAVDGRLGRTVAIKVLPEAWSESAERRRRFEREARLVSSLNHPHICSVYDVGSNDGLEYIVMEYLDGETLQQRLARGPMPWPEAVGYLGQAADALEAAHRQRIVHRDLKPANLMLTRSGLKVLDFGLAARRGASRGAVTGFERDGAVPLTDQGLIMGTLPYMAPEQLEGKATDGRTDIFALGAVGYEMVTGRQAFDGDSQAGLIGAILKDEPRPIGEFAPDVPPFVRAAICRCLAKDPDDRWQGAADFRFHLQYAASASPGPADVPRWSLRRVERLVWAAGLLAAILAGIATWMRGGGASTGDPLAPAGGVIRLPLLPPEGTRYPSSFDVPFAVSPDGRWITYVAVRADGTRQLWLRAFDSEEQRVLPGTEGAAAPFWSPDSQWVGFFADDSLKKTRVATPVTQVVASPVWASLGGAAWNRDGVIVMPGPAGLHRVPAAGGPLSDVTRDGPWRLWPQFLDDGSHYVYTSFTPRDLMVGSLSGEPSRELMTFSVNLSALGHVPGYIFFVEDGALLARPLDERTQSFAGPAKRLVAGIPVTGPGRAPFSVSPRGVLAFSTEAVGMSAVLRWFDREGRASGGITAPAKYLGFSLSPDGQRLAMARVGPNGGPDLWVRDLARATERQLTFGGLAFTPRWSPDGRRIVFTGIADHPPPTPFVVDASLTGRAEALERAPGPQFVASWGGGHVLSVRVGYRWKGAGAADDLWSRAVPGGSPGRLAVDTESNESEGSLSADGNWLAYTTDGSGRDEVWVARYPSGTPRQQLSAAGGRSPTWCAGTREVVYLDEDHRLVAVPFSGSPEGIVLGAGRPLFRIDELSDFDRTLSPTVNAYAATGDCRRFLVATRPPPSYSTPITIVAGWPSLLAR